MMELLKPISETYCNGDCPYGSLAGMIGYSSKGCDIDWVKENLQTPYVFIWEIYTGPMLRRPYIEEAHARAENREMDDSAKHFFHLNQGLAEGDGQKDLSFLMRSKSEGLASSKRP